MVKPAASPGVRSKRANVGAEFLPISIGILLGGLAGFFSGIGGAIGILSGSDG